MIYGKKATEVITWLRSKTFILALLCEAQLEHGLSNPLAVIHAVLTCWTAHYLAFRQLLDLRQSLMVLIAKDDMAEATSQEHKLVTGDAKSRWKAEEMLAIMHDPHSGML